MKQILRNETPTYVRQYPYVGENGIYVPVSDLVQEGSACAYRCILTKEMFIEAYNKWILKEATVCSKKDDICNVTKLPCCYCQPICDSRKEEHGHNEDLVVKKW